MCETQLSNLHQGELINDARKNIIVEQSDGRKICLYSLNEQYQTFKFHSRDKKIIQFSLSLILFYDYLIVQAEYKYQNVIFIHANHF